MSFKQWIHETLEVSSDKRSLSWYTDLFLMTLILLNVFAFILETVEGIYSLSPEFFLYFEYFSVLIFTIEYVFRIWTGNLNEGFERPVIGNIRYAFTPMALIDLLAILPFYLPLLGVDLRFLRILRVFRLFRLFKIARYVHAIDVLKQVFLKQKEELVVSLILLGFLLLFTSSIMFFAEHDAQPDQFSSIPATMWWGIATISTVGYGDMYPITTAGRMLAGVVVILGIAMLALPTGILATGFIAHINDRKERKESSNFCPHCGERLPKG